MIIGIEEIGALHIAPVGFGCICPRQDDGWFGAAHKARIDRISSHKSLEGLHESSGNPGRIVFPKAAHDRGVPHTQTFQRNTGFPGQLSLPGGHPVYGG